MAEVLSYAPDLRSITGGQGDYTLEFLRYEEVPAHLAQKVVAQASPRSAPRRTPERARAGAARRSEGADARAGAPRRRAAQLP